MILDAFGLRERRYVHLIGGGGKTTLMFALAHHLSRAGRTVISTTSTKILYPSPANAAHVIVESNPQRAAAHVRSALPTAGHVALAKALCDGRRKFAGYSAADLDSLRHAHVADYILVEADGSAGRSLKAHADHEPVISMHADLVIAVIGTDCLGCELTDAHVHRATRFAQLLNRPIGTPLTAEDIAAVFFHPLGYLKAVPPAADVIVLLSKAGVAAQRANARKLATALHAADHDKRIARIVLGELAGPRLFVERIH